MGGLLAKPPSAQVITGSITLEEFKNVTISDDSYANQKEACYTLLPMTPTNGS